MWTTRFGTRTECTITKGMCRMGNSNLNHHCQSKTRHVWFRSSIRDVRSHIWLAEGLEQIFRGMFVGEPAILQAFRRHLYHVDVPYHYTHRESGSRLNDLLSISLSTSKLLDFPQGSPHLVLHGAYVVCWVQVSTTLRSSLSAGPQRKAPGIHFFKAYPLHL